MALLHRWLSRMAKTRAAKRVYDCLPASLRSMPASVLGATLRRERFGAAFHDELSAIQSRLSQSRDEWEAAQLERLREVLTLARQTVPYYRQTLRDIDAQDIRSLGDWRKVPITDREEVRSSPGEFVSDALKASELHTVRTSGTTGGAMPVSWLKEAVQRQHAAWWYVRFARGYDLQSSMATFAGRPVIPAKRNKPPYWIYNRSARQWMFSGFHTRPDMLEAVCRQLTEIEVDYYNGYPSFLYLVAHEYLRLGLRPPGIRHVFTSSETLLPKQREVIEQAFQCSVVEHYGAAEGSAAYVQWSDDDHNLVLAQGHCFIEPMSGDDGSSVARGMMITTCLINPGMPLINYRIGDVATEVANSEAGAYPAPAVKRIDGRTDEYVTGRSGRRFGRLSVAATAMRNVKELQFYQDRVGELEVRIVREVGFGPDDEAHALQSLRSYLGDDLDIRLVYVEGIKRLPSGKFRSVINKL